MHRPGENPARRTRTAASGSSASDWAAAARRQGIDVHRQGLPARPRDPVRPADPRGLRWLLGAWIRVARRNHRPPADTCPRTPRAGARCGGRMLGMSGRFPGWPTTAFDVLLQLDGDPPADVREKCRQRRERLVRQPMIALLHDIADADPAYEDFTVEGFRSPAYGRWQHQYATIRIRRTLVLGLAFDLDGLRVRGVWWPSAPAEVECYRQAVADTVSGDELVEVMRTLREKGFELAGNAMKRKPRGYPADHPRAEWLRLRSLTATRPLGCEDWLHTPHTIERVLTALEELDPFMVWLGARVGEGSGVQRACW